MADRAVTDITPLDGHWQIVVGGRDVTYYRGIPATLPSMSTVDPFGWEAATLSFPQLTIDDLPDMDLDGGASGDLGWLRFGANVLIRRKIGGEPGGDVVFSGRVGRIEVNDDTVTVECTGGLVAALSWVTNPVPVMRLSGEDCTDWILRVAEYPANQIDIAGPPTGIVYQQRGSRDMTGLGFVTEVLAEAQTLSGDMWTVLPATQHGNQSYRVQLRDQTTEHAKVIRGAPGVSVSLADDIVDHPTAFYGQGTRPDGGRWNNMVTPNLGPKLTPPYPGPLEEGDTGDGVVALTRELHGNGLVDAASQTFTDEVGDAVEVVREDAGLPAGRDVDADVWAVIFASDIYSQSYGQARYAPLVRHPDTPTLTRLPDGTVMGLNPTFDPAVPWVDVFTNYGADVEKHRARRNARREYQRARQPGLAGTITLTTDPVNGYGDPFHRTLLRAGHNIRLATRTGSGGPLLHIARTDTSFDDDGTATVTLQVDQRARDYLTLEAAITRNQLAKQNPARQWRHNLLRRSAGVSDTLTGWDCESGAGVFHDVALTGGRWNVFPVIGAQSGSIARVRVEVRDACPFAMAIFGRDVTRSQLAGWAPDPLADRGDDGSWVQDNDAVLNDHNEDVSQITRLEAARGLLVYAAGTPNTLSYETLPCGYYPHQKVGDNDPTGDWQDDGSWQFYTRPWLDGARLYVAIWPTDDCTADGRLFYIVED